MNVPFTDYIGLHYTVNRLMKRIGFNSKIKDATPILRPQYSTVGAPMPGMIVNMKVAASDKVAQNAPLLIMEAMKMEATIYAEHDGEISQLLVKTRDCVEARDLLIVYK